MGEAVAEQTGLNVPERIIPVPKTISPEGQAFLSQVMPGMGPPIPHTDKERWRELVAQSEAPMLQMAETMTQAFPATISEHRLSQATLYEVTPESLEPGYADKAILHVHGGAFILCGGIACAHLAKPLASLAGMRSFSIDYRMPPDHPFPAGVEDCVEAYRFLLDRYDPARIAIEGGSAGGNLGAAAILKARDEGLPLPGAAVMQTPVVDLTRSSDSFSTNAVVDIVLRDAQPERTLLYAGGHDLDHPYLSPVFGDFTRGFPPTILLSGTRDLLLSPTVMLHRALRRAGIAAELHIGEAMPHGGFGGSAPEDRELQQEAAAFVKRHLA